MPRRSYLFSGFELRPGERALLRNGQQVPLRSRAFDLLVALVERAGFLVTKSELLDVVWPGLEVEENNLSVQLSYIRSALGETSRSDGRLIATVARHGYRFVAPVETLDSTASPSLGMGQRHNLPGELSTLIGRESTLEALATGLQRARLVTAIGPGGIGKTVVALAAGRDALPAYRDGVWLVELGSYSDPSTIPGAIAACLGLQVRPGEELADTVSALGRQHILFILDNCEHHVVAVAYVVETLLRACPGLRILATSREPLRCEGEVVHRIAPLPVPPVAGSATRTQFASAALFVDRANSALGSFKPSDDELDLIAEICRRLDGIPLAIEMAAARLRTMGLRTIRDRLDDVFSLLVSGRRTALPRQQTLRATLDWSVRLLDPPDRSLLCLLPTFAASFCADAVAAITPPEDGAHGADPIDDRLAALSDRSLLVAEAAGPEARYSLLETTRQYLVRQPAPLAGRAQERLNRWCARRLATAYVAWDLSDEADWTARFGPDVHDIRMALLDTFGPGGDVATGMAIASLAAPLWHELTLIPEHERWVATALSRITDATPLQEHARLLLARAQWHTMADKRPLEDTLMAARLFREAGDRAGEASALLAASFAKLSGPDGLPDVQNWLASAEALLVGRPPGRNSAQYYRLSGIAHWFAGERALALGAFNRALTLCRELGLTGQYVRSAGSLAQRHCAAGAFELAESTALEALALCPGGLAWSAPAIHLIGLLASYRLARRDWPGAAHAAHMALSRAKAGGLRHEFVWGVERCAIAGAEEQPNEAAALLGYCDEAYHAAGRQRFEESINRYRTTTGLLYSKLGPARFKDAIKQGAALAEQEAIERALNLAGMVADEDTSLTGKRPNC